MGDVEEPFVSRLEKLPPQGRRNQQVVLGAPVVKKCNPMKAVPLELKDDFFLESENYVRKLLDIFPLKVKILHDVGKSP